LHLWLCDWNMMGFMSWCRWQLINRHARSVLSCRLVLHLDYNLQHVHVAPSKYLQMDPIIPYKCIATSTRGVQVVQRQIHGCMVGLQDQLHTHTTSWVEFM
jgi:hypothetical protein